MGWSFYSKPRHQTLREHLDGECTWENESGKRTVLKSAMVGSTYYAAVQHVHPDGKVEVWAAVILTKRDRDPVYNLGVKHMDETAGPYECKCPMGILKLLTPPLNDYAAQWREKCRAYAARVKIRPEPGQVVVFPEPIRFTDGHQETMFMVEKIPVRRKSRLVFRSQSNGRLYAIPKITEQKFEVRG